MSTATASPSDTVFPFTKRLWAPHDDASLSEGLYHVTTSTEPMKWDQTKESRNHWFDPEFSKRSDPGFTKRFLYMHTSTDSLASKLVAHMRENASYVPRNPPELRIYAFPVDGGLPGQLVLYYEVDYAAQSLMVGYVTNYSGAGREGKRNLDSLFLLLLKAFEKQGAQVDYYESVLPLPKQIALQLL